MKKKILIIGLNSFLGSSLFNFLKKKKLNTAIASYSKFLKFKKNKIKNYDYIINCSSNIKYVNHVYNYKNDNDVVIAKKIQNFKTKQIFLSTRKVYKPKFNIKENSLKKPTTNYSKNKLITENILKKILNKRLIILRISNVIGLSKRSKKKLHNTFSDIFFYYASKGKSFNNESLYKDFISINKFCQILFELIKIDTFGVYNVSLGKKIYLNKISKWLNYFNKKKLTLINLKESFNNECFTLNNNKLMKKIKISNNIIELKKDCVHLSRDFFLK